MSFAIEGRDLKRYYSVKGEGFFAPQATLKAVDGASFALESGNTLAIVGESGCGKSTLARLATMIEVPSAGKIFISGSDPHANGGADIPRLRQDVQIIFQNPYGSLNPRKKVGTILEEPVIINQKVSAAERRQLAETMLAKVGLRPEHYDRYPHMFSGGQRQRIAIARALMLKPKVLIADEPVSALDISIQAQVLNILMDLQEEMDLALVFISHDLSVVRRIADQIMVMYLGKVVEQGEAEAIFANPAHPYTQALLGATPAVDPKLRRERIKLSGELPSPLNPPPGCSFHNRCRFAKPLCSETAPELELAYERQVACHFVKEAVQD
ncbi:MAG: dipeptide transport system ATP-binding protein [Gammaproteobacteria bacterium]|jgi:dipeptide transport system ATP-binding protein